MRFKERNPLHDTKVQGEAAASCLGDIDEGGCTEHQVFKVSETAPYWKMSSRTFIARGKSTPGKASKNRLTLVMGQCHR